MNLQDLTSNLLIVIAELPVIILLFVVLNWIVRRFLRAVVAAPALRRFAQGAESLRQNIRLLLWLVCLALCVGVVAVNGYLLYTGENLASYTLALIQGIPREFWTSLAIAMAKTVGLVIIAAIVVRWLRRLLDFLCTKAKAFEGIKANDTALDRVNAGNLPAVRDRVNRAWP
jgi:small conductance mechanosensitive channel